MIITMQKLISTSNKFTCRHMCIVRYSYSYIRVCILNDSGTVYMNVDLNIETRQYQGILIEVHNRSGLPMVARIRLKSEKKSYYTPTQKQPPDNALLLHVAKSHSSCYVYVFHIIPDGRNAKQLESNLPIGSNEYSASANKSISSFLRRI